MPFRHQGSQMCYNETVDGWALSNWEKSMLLIESCQNETLCSQPCEGYPSPQKPLWGCLAMSCYPMWCSQMELWTAHNASYCLRLCMWHNDVGGNFWCNRMVWFMYPLHYFSNHNSVCWHTTLHSYIPMVQLFKNQWFFKEVIISIAYDINSSIIFSMFTLK